MRSYHWGAIVLFLFVGYMLGVYLPGPGVTLRAKVGF